MNYATGQVARLSGLPVATVRFYSDAGLVPPVGRTAGGYRLYDQEELHPTGPLVDPGDLAA